MLPASEFARRPLDDVLEGASDGHPPSRRRRRALTRGAGGPGAPPTARPATGAEPVADAGDRDGGSVRVDPAPGAARRRRRPRPRTVAVAVALLLAIGTSLALGQRVISTADRTKRYRERLEAATARVDRLVAEAAQQLSLVSSLEGQLSQMHEQVADIRASKVRTVVQTEVVTKKVPRWVPNGTGIDVDTTGFEERIAIHDVQLTRAYGYSHLIGIAINRSNETLSYVQLGCTFVDADGRLLANEMVNKATWAPGQSWGFDCAAQVDATGGMLRVDEMT